MEVYQKVTEAQKRSIVCPECGARPGYACKGSRIPGANTFGGGWGGPPNLDSAHRARRQAYLDKMAEADKAGKACRACGKTLMQCNENPECSETNSYEHDIPGYTMHTILTPVG